MNYFIILPNQLFDLSFYNKNNNYIIYEHPQYFTKYNFNKKKLILHKASMELFYDNMKKNKYNVKYVSFNNKINYNENMYSISDSDKKNLEDVSNFQSKLNLFFGYAF